MPRWVISDRDERRHGGIELPSHIGTSDVRRADRRHGSQLCGATATDTGKASIDPGSNAVTGELYTWDPTGANSFNAVDVNHDGMMNLDDALVVDKFAGESYSSLANQVSATISSNGTIDPTLANQVPFDLVNATLVDYGSNNPAVNKIQQGDMNVMNQALTGTFNYAWYNGETKVGSLNIVASPAAGSKFQVPTGATFTISNGTFTAGGAVDPLTDSTSTGIDTSKSLNVVVNGTGSLVYAANTGSGFQVYKLNSLTVQAGGKAALVYSRIDAKSHTTGRRRIVIPQHHRHA